MGVSASSGLNEHARSGEKGVDVRLHCVFECEVSAPESNLDTYSPIMEHLLAAEERDGRIHDPFLAVDAVHGQMELGLEVECPSMTEAIVLATQTVDAALVGHGVTPVGMATHRIEALA